MKGAVQLALALPQTPGIGAAGKGRPGGGGQPQQQRDRLALAHQQHARGVDRQGDGGLEHIHADRSRRRELAADAMKHLEQAGNAQHLACGLAWGLPWGLRPPWGLVWGLEEKFHVSKTIEQLWKNHRKTIEKHKKIHRKAFEQP